MPIMDESVLILEKGSLLEIMERVRIRLICNLTPYLRLSEFHSHQQCVGFCSSLEHSNMFSTSKLN